MGKTKFTINGFTTLPVSSSSPPLAFDLNERDTDRISPNNLLRHHTLLPSFSHYVRQRNLSIFQLFCLIFLSYDSVVVGVCFCAGGGGGGCFAAVAVFVAVADVVER